MSRPVVLAVLIAVPFAAGCPAGGPEFGEVEGAVTLDGQPLPNVEVAFLPQPAAGTKGPPAGAITDAAGRYRLRTGSVKRDGAVVGTHVVTVIDIEALPSAGGAGPTDAAARAGPKTPRVPPRYERATETPLQRVEVKPGQQELNFDIPSGRKRPSPPAGVQP